MQSISSATPLEAVQVEPNGYGGADVWLHDNVVETFVEDGDGGQAYWMADEVHGVVAGIPTAGEIEEDFDAWWERFEEESLTDAERFERLEAQVLFTALMTDTEVS